LIERELHHTPQRQEIDNLTNTRLNPVSTLTTREISEFS
jgi:hypothetical protein